MTIDQLAVTIERMGAAPPKPTLDAALRQLAQRELLATDHAPEEGYVWKLELLNRWLQRAAPAIDAVTR